MCQVRLHFDGKSKFLFTFLQLFVQFCFRSSIGHSCTYDGSIGHFPDATECKQIFKKHSFLAIDFDGSIQFDDFQIPTACACYIKDISPFKK